MASGHTQRPPAFVRFGHRIRSLLTHPALRQRVRQGAVSLLLLLTLLCGPNGLLTNVSVSFAQAQASSPGTPNRFDPRQDATSVTHPPSTGKSDPNWKAGKPQPLTHPKLPMMPPGSLTLHDGQAATFLGSDGRLEVDVPASAVTATDRTQAGGSLSLLVSQIAPASGSSAGGSGHISLGTYLLQLVDAHGKRVNHGWHTALILKWHVRTGENIPGLAQAFVVFNSALPAGTTLAPTAVASTPTLGAVTTQHATLDATQQTLAVTITPASSSTSLSWNTNSPVAVFGKPDLFNVGLNTGSLTLDYPLDLPAGPNGQMPPLSLSYSSEGVSEQHSVQGTAGWVGEGWSLAPGSISWAEHNVQAGVSGAFWQNSWQLSDPYGTSSELIPPTLTTSIYNDDTGNGLTAEPIVWHTATESHAKIISFTGPVNISGTSINVPCFRVFLPNGIMEEFGCTTDSVQYYNQLSGSNTGKTYVSNWLLDLITDRNGNQIHFTYQTDWVLDKLGGWDMSDTELATVEWDSPTCRDAQNSCTGASWTPLLRVNFWADHNPTHLTNSPSGCNTGTNLRCDDPLDLTGSSGEAAPQVEGGLVLNDLYVQVRTSGTGSWNNLKHYQLSYEQSGPTTITDPTTSQAESTAGMLDLTQIQVFGDDGTTTLPTSTFSYTTQTEYYVDDAYRAPAGNCGPTWNSGCLLWSQSYAGNSRYLTTADNGMGLHQAFSWGDARNNTHGVNGGGSNIANPLYCDTVSNPGTYPCNEADDQAWSHMVLTQEQDQVIRLSQSGQGGQQTSTPVTSNTYYSYLLTYPLSAQACSDCVAGMYWGNQNDADYLDYYNGKFQGFTQATVTHPDGSVEVHKYLATSGWGLYDTSQVTCYSVNPCHNAPWWWGSAEHGHEYEGDAYDTNGTTLLSKTQTQYQLQCPPSGVSGTGSTSYGNFDGNLVSELDHGNPVAVCAIYTSQVDTYTYDGSTASGVPHQTTTSTYDSYGRLTSQTTTSNNGGATGSPTTLVHTALYVWNDAVTATATSATGTYLIDFTAYTDTEDTAGNRYTCLGSWYDGLSWESGAQSNFTGAGKVTLSDAFAFCGTKANGFADKSGRIVTTSTYDPWGNPLTSTDADANAGISGHTGCTVGGTAYTTCTAYDPTFEALPISSANALNQTSSLGYGNPTSPGLGGYGRWPTSATDANGQTATATYDALGRMTSQTLPGETSGLTTASRTYTDFCAASGAQSPCLEIDSTQRLNSTTTVTTRSFYDGWGNLVETRSQAPNNQDVVQYYYYDPSNRQVFASLRYFVSAYTGAPGAAAYSIPDSTQNIGTTTTYTNLLSTTVTDVLSHASTTSSAVVCNQQTPSGGTDSACYVQSSAVDPLGHKQSTLTDALGREVYDQRYTGNSTSTYAIYSTTQYTYNYLGNLVQILHPGGSITSTFQYDMLGRQTGMTDPDRGTESYAYDPNGNVVQTADARGSAGTIYAGYDGLDRQLWRNTTNSASGAYVTYSYDSTANGNHGVGYLTGETFTNGSLTGSYSTMYDQRGQPISMTETVGTAQYTSQATYDDAGNLLTKTYPDGEVVTASYTPQAWLAGMSTQQGSTTTTLLSNVAYNGTAGAGGMITGASLGGGTYTYAAAYDLLLRLTDSKVTRTSDGATMFEQAITYDQVSNVSHLTTTLPQGTDQQQFCYDEQNRMTWAGAVGTPPCTGTAMTSGSLTSAQYSQSYAFDALDRLTSGSQGTYTYGDSHHLDAVTSISGGYTASYDAAGNMTCRAPTSVTTCAGSTPTGAQFAYDNEGRLAHWQNTPSSPTTAISYLYDGAGNRVAQQVTGTATTTTVYVGSIEEVTTSGSTTTTTTYYYANGQRIALAVNGVFSYLCTDILGSVAVALDGSGNVQASQLYGPYGSVRYSSGTMPGSYGFTGQHADSASGLDYYGARYYDPASGTFTSADTMLPGGGADPAGLNRYAYVGGNPETITDPSGHCGLPCIIIILMIAAAGAAMLSEAWREHEQGGFTIRNGHIASIEQINDGFQRARHYYPDSPIDPHEDLRHRFYDYPAPDPSPPPSPTPVPIQQGGPSQQGGPGPGRATIGAGVAPGVQATPPPEAQNLPVRQSGDPTDCVLVGPNGQTEELSSKSGKHYTGAGVAAGVKGWPGFVNPDNGNPLGPDSTNSHCEAEAIATMITNGWTSGQLWINNSPCKPGERFSCATLMDTRLGSGRKLDIFVSDNLSCGDNLWRPWPFDGGC